MGFLCSFRGEHYTYWINHFTFDVGGGGGGGGAGGGGQFCLAKN